MDSELKAVEHPTLGELARVFARIGCISFGGPAGQIALMQHEIVERLGWIEQGAFLRALNLCHLLPGPEAQQLATWIGWRLHGVRGGVAAGGLFVLPGAVVMATLSLLYAQVVGLAWFAGLFLGVKAAVLAIVAQALLRIGRRTLGTPFARVVAAAALLLLLALQVPFPLVIIGAGAIGSVVGMVRPGWMPGAHADPTAARAPMPGLGTTLRTALTWLAVWWAPMALVLVTLGRGHMLWQVGTFFARLAVVSFGGAYAVLSYMAQAAVAQHGWLSAADMANGLALAETTPGPLILVTQFVGFLAGWHAPAPFAPLAGALLAAALTTWMTFAPCFVWIFTAAPWMERLEHTPRLHAALSAITAAVVGVIGQLTLWFASHVLFAGPGLRGFDGRAAAIAMVSAVLLFRLRRGIVTVLTVAAGLGWVMTMLHSPM
ncbi:MAG: chromate efflux transporter [Sphingomonadales bacterium]|nr:chromate efflux transporter [Sphingomonadales bacterium]